MAFSGSFKPFSLLITGAPGWLCGTVLSSLGDALPALTRVRCLIQSSAPEPFMRGFRQSNPSVTETVSGDLLNPDSLRAACKNMSGGVVLHAAAVYQPRVITDYYSVNRDGALSLATIAKQAGVRRFVFISSLAAQGASKSAHTLLTEEMPCRPYSHYGKSKLEAEKGLIKLNAPGVFDVVIVRPGPFYGIPVPAHHIELFKRIQRGRATVINGGKFRRSWSFINDVANCILVCLIHPGAAGETFNLCDAQSYTQREIFETIAYALDVKLKTRNLPGLAASALHLTANIRARFNRFDSAWHAIGELNRHSAASSQKAQRVLGFAPSATLEQGIKSAVEWCRDQGVLE